jgi:hypothetical protein
MEIYHWKSDQASAQNAMCRQKVYLVLFITREFVKGAGIVPTASGTLGYLRDFTEAKLQFETTIGASMCSADFVTRRATLHINVKCFRKISTQVLVKLQFFPAPVNRLPRLASNAMN